MLRFPVAHQRFPNHLFAGMLAQRRRKGQALSPDKVAMRLRPGRPGQGDHAPAPLVRVIAQFGQNCREDRVYNR
jgi:hypothetical protein